MAAQGLQKVVRGLLMADSSRTRGSQPISREAPIMRDLRNLKELPPGRVVSRCWALHRSTQFLQPPPFGKVWVEVGPEVIPGGLRFFNISRTAREEGTWELMVLNRLVTQGGHYVGSFQHLPKDLAFLHLFSSPSSGSLH